MHPILFIALGRPVHAYGFLLGLAFFAGLGFAVWSARRAGHDVERTLAVGLVAAAAAMVGARLQQVLAADRAAFLEHPSRIFDPAFSGYAFLGGFVLAFCATVVATRVARLQFWETADSFCIAVAGGLIPVRLGCFLAGCCHGLPADDVGFPAALAVVFPDVTGSRAVLQGVPLVPTQLLEASAGALALSLMLWRWPRRRFGGELVAMFLLVYGGARFALELVRGDPRGAALGLTTAQLTLLVPMALAAWALFRPSARVRALELASTR